VRETERELGQPLWKRPGARTRGNMARRGLAHGGHVRDAWLPLSPTVEQLACVSVSILGCRFGLPRVRI
jgi:hypothetical protein